MKTSFAGIAISCCLLAGVVGCFMSGHVVEGQSLLAVWVGQFITSPVTHHEGEP